MNQNNIVDKNYISNLISTSHDSTSGVQWKVGYQDHSSVDVKGILNYTDNKQPDVNAKSRKMTANEESKDGFNHMKNYVRELESNDVQTHKIGSKYAPKTRAPLQDTTNGKSKSKVTRNPITGDAEVEKPIKTSVAPIKAPILKQEKSEEEMGVDIDELIRQKEEELKQVMERLSVSSTTKEQAPKTLPDKKLQEKKVQDKKIPEKKVNIKQEYKPALITEEKKDSGHYVHGHPSFPEYSHKGKVYSASGMRNLQFHSKAPWATE